MSTRTEKKVYASEQKNLAPRARQIPPPPNPRNDENITVPPRPNNSKFARVLEEREQKLFESNPNNFNREQNRQPRRSNPRFEYLWEKEEINPLPTLIKSSDGSSRLCLIVNSILDPEKNDHVWNKFWNQALRVLCESPTKDGRCQVHTYDKSTNMYFKFPNKIGFQETIQNFKVATSEYVERKNRVQQSFADIERYHHTCDTYIRRKAEILQIQEKEKLEHDVSYKTCGVKTRKSLEKLHKKINSGVELVVHDGWPSLRDVQKFDIKTSKKKLLESIKKHWELFVFIGQECKEKKWKEHTSLRIYPQTGDLLLEFFPNEFYEYILPGDLNEKTKWFEKWVKNEENELVGQGKAELIKNYGQRLFNQWSDCIALGKTQTTPGEGKFTLLNAIDIKRNGDFEAQILDKKLVLLRRFNKGFRLYYYGNGKVVGINYGVCSEDTHRHWDVFYPGECINSIRVGFTSVNSAGVKFDAFVITTSNRRVFRSHPKRFEPQVIKHWVAPKGHEIEQIIIKGNRFVPHLDIVIRPVAESNSNSIWEQFFQSQEAEEEGRNQIDNDNETEQCEILTTYEPIIPSKIKFNKEELIEEDCRSQTSTNLSEGYKHKETETDDDFINYELSPQQQGEEENSYQFETKFDYSKYLLPVNTKAAEFKLKDALKYGYMEVLPTCVVVYYHKWMYSLDSQTSQILSVDHNIWNINIAEMTEMETETEGRDASETKNIVLFLL